MLDHNLLETTLRHKLGRLRLEYENDVDFPAHILGEWIEQIKLAMLAIDDKVACSHCYGVGEVPVCGWCEQGEYHSSCDDSWQNVCKVCEGRGY